MPETVIYTKTGCPYCKAAMDEFKKDGTDFKEVNVSEDPEALKMVKEKFSASKVPVIVKDGKLVEVGHKGGG